MFSYIWFKKDESKDLLLICIVLSALFAILTIRFSNYTSDSLIGIFIQYLVFFTILLFSRLLFMKFIAYKHGFQIFLHQSTFTKYGPRKFDSLSAFARDSLNKKFKGLPSTLLAIIIYILTFGFLIFPSMWRYSTKTIPHLYVGTQEKYEYGMGFMLRRSITEYRITKVLFSGYVYYLIFAIIMKIVLPQEMFYSWFLFALFWVSLFTLIPIIGTEGYDLYAKSRLSHISAIVILTLGMMSVIVFESLASILGVTAIIGSLTIFVIFYKYFL